jgi:hypothetical protein
MLRRTYIACIVATAVVFHPITIRKTTKERRNIAHVMSIRVALQTPERK